MWWRHDAPPPQDHSYPHPWVERGAFPGDKVYSGMTAGTHGQNMQLCPRVSGGWRREDMSTVSFSVIPLFLQTITGQRPEAL